jgi:uncharacterized protein YbjT (DUF2867 family)
LLAAGLDAVPAQRNPKSPGARKFDFSDTSTFDTAFTGINKLFLMRPPAVSNVKKFMFPAIDAAIDAGVSHFVFLSLQGADKNSVVPHRKVEDYLKSKKTAWTFIRPSFFMQNLTTTHLAEIRDKSEIFVPAGSGRTNFVDTRDVAFACFTALTRAGHENKAYEITGPQALAYYEIAEIIGSAVGRKITYKKPSPFSFFIRKLKEGHPFNYALVTTAIYSVSALGMASGTSDDFFRMTGRKPADFTSFAAEYAGVWKKV